MRARLLVALAAFGLLVTALPRPVAADPKSDVSAKLKAAMEAYDTFDYDGARKQINAAITLAKKSHLDKDAVLAKAYLDLGIVAFAVPDQDAAKQAFTSAVQIDSKIQIDVAYKSPELAKLLDSVRSSAGSSGSSGGGGDDLGLGPDTGSTSGGGGDCAGLKGIDHALVDSAKGGAPLKLEAKLGSDVKAAKVSIMFRVEGSTEFTEVKMSKQGDCAYSGTIPGAAMKGSLVHYYIAAYDGGGKSLASKGSAGSPNIIEVTAATGGGKVGPGDDEDPLGGGKKVAQVPTGGGENPDNGSGGSVTVGVETPGKPKKLWLGLNGGTGFGYVTGTTEGMNTVKNCCIGASLVALNAELAYQVNPQLAIGGVFRMGLPLGANLAGHATGAPSGLLRVHYAFAETGEGFHVVGEVGYGFLRNTIKLDQASVMNGMDTDIVAQGPLLLGAGAGYTKKLSDMFAFVVDLDAMAGIAIAKTVGISPMNNGLSADISIGLQIGLF